MKDLDIIKQIEKELNVLLIETTDKRSNVYNLNKFGQITYLGLDNCNLTNLNRTIPMLKELSNLTELALTDNHLTDISALKSLQNLEGLYLQDNQISDISPLRTLQNLTWLNLHNNPIEELSPWITDFNMKIRWEGDGRDGYITFFNNPLKSPPPEIVKQGKEAVKNYFEQLAKSKKKYKKDFYLFESKLLIIGEAGAGKTTFARKIKNPDAVMPKLVETTRGIDVYKWNFDVTKDEFPKLIDLKMNKTKFYLNLWDFGGQAIYHGTHQFFFSKNALYVLLADTREQKTDFNYWLLTIEQLAGNSPLMIVLNKREGHTWQIDETGYRSRYGEIIKEIVTANLSNPKEIPQLQKSIKFWLEKLPQIGDKLPASWVNIREGLNKENKSFITFERFKEICDTHEISKPEDIDLLSRYYDNIGVITHFIDDPVLEERVYLDSNWLVKTIYRLLDDKNVKKQHGRIKKAQIENIWKDNELYHETNKLLQLMQRFGLLYQIKGKDGFIVPEHLPEKMPYEEWPHKGNLLQFRYKFDNYMPKGLMSHLIVELHHHIKDHDLVWHRGVNVAYKGAKAEIIETYGGINRFDIRVAGKNRKELLIRIIERFDEILSRFKKLSHKKLVPCICKECKTDKQPHFYEFKELEKRIEKGRYEVECDKSYEMINVQSLIDEVTDKELTSDKSKTRTKPAQRKKSKRNKVFISYSRKDKKWLERVQVNLKVLKKIGFTIKVWDDTQIKSGMKWKAEIEKGLSSAKVAILLISTDFLASDFIDEIELPALLKASENDGATILPLILKPSLFTKHKELAEFQSVNDPKKPLSKLSENDQDEVLVNLADRIAELMKE
ncbi:MAG: TIR domain-containing protein [Candidatus Brocadiaceae bacterium]|nr:TIR domain-containing protein [Candidatus Brocadiaceae bacterium]